MGNLCATTNEAVQGENLASRFLPGKHKRRQQQQQQQQHMEASVPRSLLPEGQIPMFTTAHVSVNDYTYSARGNSGREAFAPTSTAASHPGVPAALDRNRRPLTPVKQRTNSTQQEHQRPPRHPVTIPKPPTRMNTEDFITISGESESNLAGDEAIRQQAMNYEANPHLLSSHHREIAAVVQTAPVERQVPKEQPIVPSSTSTTSSSAAVTASLKKRQPVVASLIVDDLEPPIKQQRTASPAPPVLLRKRAPTPELPRGAFDFGTYCKHTLYDAEDAGKMGMTQAPAPQQPALLQQVLPNEEENALTPVQVNAKPTQKQTPAKKSVVESFDTDDEILHYAEQLSFRKKAIEEKRMMIKKDSKGSKKHSSKKFQGGSYVSHDDNERQEVLDSFLANVEEMDIPSEGEEEENANTPTATQNQPKGPPTAVVNPTHPQKPRCIESFNTEDELLNYAESLSQQKLKRLHDLAAGTPTHPVVTVGVKAKPVVESYNTDDDLLAYAEALSAQKQKGKKFSSRLSEKSNNVVLTSDKDDASDYAATFTAETSSEKENEGEEEKQQNNTEKEEVTAGGAEQDAADLRIFENFIAKRKNLTVTDPAPTTTTTTTATPAGVAANRSSADSLKLTARTATAPYCRTPPPSVNLPVLPPAPPPLTAEQKQRVQEWQQQVQQRRLSACQSTDMPPIEEEGEDGEPLMQRETSITFPLTDTETAPPQNPTNVSRSPGATRSPPRAFNQRRAFKMEALPGDLASTDSTLADGAAAAVATPTATTTTTSSSPPTAAQITTSRRLSSTCRAQGPPKAKQYNRDKHQHNRRLLKGATNDDVPHRLSLLEIPVAKVPQPNSGLFVGNV